MNLLKTYKKIKEQPVLTSVNPASEHQHDRDQDREINELNPYACDPQPDYGGWKMVSKIKSYQALRETPSEQMASEEAV